MPADDFFVGPMVTAIAAGRLRQRDPLSGLAAAAHRRRAFFEVNARRSDFAFVCAAAQVALDDDGRCIDVALGIGGVGDRPLRLDVSSLVGTELDDGVGRRTRSMPRWPISRR